MVQDFGVTQSIAISRPISNVAVSKECDVI